MDGFWIGGNQNKFNGPPVPVTSAPQTPASAPPPVTSAPPQPSNVASSAPPPGSYMSLGPFPHAVHPVPLPAAQPASPVVNLALPAVQPVVLGQSPQSAPAGLQMVQPVSAVVPGGGDMKKKRGRPRKYEPGMKPRSIRPVSATPISSSVPLRGSVPSVPRSISLNQGSGAMSSGNLFGWPENAAGKPTVHAAASIERVGGEFGFSVGSEFTPMVISVTAQEDVNQKIIKVAQVMSRAICILSANGFISNVTLRQPNTGGGTLTYEGRFEIISLSGSFLPTDNALTKCNTGGMAITMVGQDGRILGGGLAGVLIAAGPVQVVIGSFLPGHHIEHKAKKQRIESTPAHQTNGKGTQKSAADPIPSFNPMNSAPLNSTHGTGSLDHDNDDSLRGSDSNEPGSSDFDHNADS